MKLGTRGTLSATIILLSALCEGSKHGLSHLVALERKHQHHRRLHMSAPEEEKNITPQAELKKRGQCAFPTDAGLVAVTPDQQNGGWAMSPDQSCTAGNYCPYACPPGQLAMQWNPQATSYTYPLSMDGGLYCDENGDVQKPFPDQDYCVAGVGTLSAQNNAGKTVSFCQTVLPGNEAMLIPTAVDDLQTLAVPGMDYWCSTAAHYYVNDPGLTTDQACVWGDGSQPLGNWSPYVAGVNVDSSGNTFAKLGWNPEYTGSSFAGTMPSWGMKIECDGDGCNGLPCSIDPSENSMNQVTSSESADGAGGASFCVATIPQGMTAKIVVFNAGDSAGSSSSASTSASSSEEPAPSVPAPSIPLTTSTPPPPPAYTPVPTTSSIIAPPPPPPSTSSTPVSITPSSTPIPTVHSIISINSTTVSSSSISIITPVFVSAPKNTTDPQITFHPTGGYSAHNNFAQSQTGTDMLANPTATLGSHLSSATAGAAANGTKKPSSASITFRNSGVIGATGLTVVAVLVSWLL